MPDSLPTPPVQGLSVRVLDRLEGADFRWPRIADLSDWDGFIFQSREFLTLWQATIGAGRGSRACFVVVSDRNGPVLLLPLCIERRHGIRLLRFMDGGVADYNAPLLRRGWDGPADGFGRLWAAILKALPRFDAVELRKVSARAGAVANPLASLPGLGVIGGSRSVATGESWAGYLAEPSRHRYHGVTRRKLRALERLGAVTFETITEAGAADPVRAFLFAHKSRQYLRTTGADPFELPGYREFFTGVSQPPYLGQIGHLSCIRCDGELIAAHLGYAGDGRFYQIMPVYDAERFAAISPGRIHLEQMLEGCFADSTASFEFGEGVEAYKDVWATEAEPLYLLASARTVQGHAALWLNSWRRRRIERRAAGAPTSKAEDQSASTTRRNATAARGSV